MSAPSGQIGRSLLAGFAGVLTVVGLSTGTDALLHATGIFPPWQQRMSDLLFVLATVYRTLYGVAGGYLTALLAPRNPMGHALTLGAIGMVFGLIGLVVTWNADMGPRWYPIALVVLALPQSWAGARLAARGPGES
jgi:hypothetical protein